MIVNPKHVVAVSAELAENFFLGKSYDLEGVDLPSDAEAKKFVAANPNAIGYIDKAAVDGSVKVVLTP